MSTASRYPIKTILHRTSPREFTARAVKISAARTEFMSARQSPCVGKKLEVFILRMKILISVTTTRSCLLH